MTPFDAVRRALLAGSAALGLVGRARAAPLPVGSGWVNLYWTVSTPPPMGFASTDRTERTLADPELPPHLRGLSGYVMSAFAGRTPTAAEVAALLHVWKVQGQCSLRTTDDQADALAAWARAANALVFFGDGTLRNPDGEVLVGPGASATAQPPWPREAIERRARVTAALAAEGIGVPPHLPPVTGETELRLRAPAEVRARALGLAQVAVRAESFDSGKPIPRGELETRLPGAAVTAREDAFLHAKRPKAQERVDMRWRYEGLWTLLWALGLVELGPPTEPCSAEAAMRGAFELVGRTDLVLSPSAVLDRLDELMRRHWWEREHPTSGPADSTLSERRVALGWLVQLGGFDWEEIPIPT
jgi:hypothetical protein